MVSASSPRSASSSPRRGCHQQPGQLTRWLPPVSVEPGSGVGRAPSRSGRPPTEQLSASCLLSAWRLVSAVMRATRRECPPAGQLALGPLDSLPDPQSAIRLPACLVRTWQPAPAKGPYMTTDPASPEHDTFSTCAKRSPRLRLNPSAAAGFLAPIFVAPRRDTPAGAGRVWLW